MMMRCNKTKYIQTNPYQTKNKLEFCCLESVSTWIHIVLNTNLCVYRINLLLNLSQVFLCCPNLVENNKTDYTYHKKQTNDDNF